MAEENKLTPPAESAVLAFNLDTEDGRIRFNEACKSRDMVMALNDIKDRLRTLDRYGEEFLKGCKTKSAVITKIREDVCNIVAEYELHGVLI